MFAVWGSWGSSRAPAWRCWRQAHPSALAASGYDYYLDGDAADVSPATTAGLLLAGGATDNDDAMRWFLDRSGGGDVVVLDAYGRDDYGPYIYSDLGGVDSVQSFVFKQRSASWDPFVLETLAHAEAIFIDGGNQWNYVSLWQDTPVEDLINVDGADEARGRHQRRPRRAGRVLLRRRGSGRSAPTRRSRTRTTRTCGWSRTSCACRTWAGPSPTATSRRANRMGRLMTFLARIVNDGWAAQARGIGVDESTTVAVDERGRAQVFGLGAAYLLRTNGAPEVCVKGAAADVHERERLQGDPRRALRPRRRGRARAGRPTACRRSRACCTRRRTAARSTEDRWTRRDRLRQSSRDGHVETGPQCSHQSSGRPADRRRCRVGRQPGRRLGRRLPVFALCVAAAFLVQWIVFVPSYLARNEGFFDLTGGLTYISVTVLAVALGPPVDGRSLLLLVLVTAWALRLGSYLFRRIRRAGHDVRFDAIKTSFWRFLSVWTIQGLWVSLTLAAALAAITTEERRDLDPWALAGALVWLAGFALEATADVQKSRFRADPANKGRFIAGGLWSWSRHPNYFGEIVLWVGVALIAVPVLDGWQWVTLVSPFFVALLLIKVSGIPLLEKSAGERWGGQDDYEAYKRATSVLVPRPPRRRLGGGTADSGSPGGAGTASTQGHRSAQPCIARPSRTGSTATPSVRR